MADYAEAIRLNPEDAGAFNDRGLAQVASGAVRGSNHRL